MEDQETKHVNTPAPEDLATDVAHLYSLANVEDLHYRVFSRHRPGTRPGPLSEVTDKASAKEAPESLAQVAAESTISSTVVAPLSERISSKPENTTGATAVVLQETSRNHWSESENCAAKTGVLTSVAIVSIAGGVGKTTIAANLGRVLCSLGELVLLVDASGSGLLPFYFGAADLRPGLRTFWAPEANSPPMHVIGSEEITQEWLAGDVTAATRTVQRAIFDLGPSSANMLPEVLGTCAAVVVPVLSDLNSILTIARLEASIKTLRDKGVCAPLPFYISNKFDDNSPAEQQGRELIARQVGERLLPITIRRSPNVAKAIADRMTVADHSPESDITQDFLELATWLRKTAPIPQPVKAVGRWSER
jgi:cellulose synthase operon protein YhjQ